MHEFDYATSRQKRPKNAASRDWHLVTLGFFTMGGCLALGSCMNFMTSLKYIDGAAGNPIALEDQVTILIGDGILLLGCGLFIAALA